MVVSETPIAWDFARWRRVLESYRINGRTVFDLTRDADRAELDRLMSWEASLPPGAARGEEWPIEHCPDILARTADKRLMTDDNMGSEWLHFLGSD